MGSHRTNRIPDKTKHKSRMGNKRNRRKYRKDGRIMELYLYAIRDTKMGFMAPYTQPNDQIAKRNFLAQKEDKDSMIKLFPEDFELWNIGKMDEKNGMIDQKEMHEIIRGDETI